MGAEVWSGQSEPVGARRRRGAWRPRNRKQAVSRAGSLGVRVGQLLQGAVTPATARPKARRESLESSGRGRR